jgi:hypothetical protein
MQTFLFFETDRNPQAESLIRNVLERSTRVMGPDKEMTLECKDLLGRILGRKGDHEHAERMHREVLEKRIDILGDNDTSTSSTLLYLAGSLYDQSKYEESSQYAERALKSYFETYGGDHPGTEESVALLVKVFDAAGKTGEANSLLQSLGLKE